MIYLKLFYEFFKVGLFAVGGGLATIPFLRQVGAETGWFGEMDLANIIAISESTPGPLGVNMATYVGFETAGIPGAVIATLGLVAPSILVILIIAGFLEKFRQSRAVDAVFYGLRPASTALIAVAGLSVGLVAFGREVSGPGSGVAVHWPSVLLCAAVFVCMRCPGLKKLHPIWFIAASAAAGVIFRF